jgi:hypothetical protein
MSNPTQDQSQASQSQVPESHQKNLPTMYDLPSEFPEEPGLADEFHDFQPQLLRETFASPVYPDWFTISPFSTVKIWDDCTHC